jgi:hypothetical protein
MVSAGDNLCELLRTMPPVYHFLEPCVWSGSSAKIYVIISREIVRGMRGQNVQTFDF